MDYISLLDIANPKKTKDTLNDLIESVNTAFAESHTHANKTLLDSLSSADLERWDAKQNALDTAQLAAVNSGINSTKVAAILANTEAITALQNSKQDNLTTAQLDAVNSGIDSTKVTQISTNANNILSLQAIKYGAAIDVSLDTTDYKLTMSLKDQDGTVLNSKVVDFPIESVVVNGSFDSTNKKVILVLQNGNTIDIPVGDLIAGLQSEITSNNKLDSDLVDDTNQAHKFVSAQEKTTWNGKQDALTAGDNIDITNNTINAKDVVTTDADQTVGGTKTFLGQQRFKKASEGGGYFYISPDGNGYNAKIGFSSGGQMMIHNGGFQIDRNLSPMTANSNLDLGTSNVLWSNLYLKGNLKDGTNSIAIADIANKNEILLKPLSLSTTTMTDEQIATLRAYNCVLTNDLTLGNTSLKAGTILTVPFEYSNSLRGMAIYNNRIMTYYIALTSKQIGDGAQDIVISNVADIKTGKVTIDNYTINKDSFGQLQIGNNNATSMQFDGGTVRAQNLVPIGNNSKDLGNSSQKWKDLHLAGNLTDGTNSVSIADIASKNHVLDNYISYTEAQTLTDAQKAQARQNIGAGSASATTVVVNGVDQASVLFDSDPQTQIDGKQATIDSTHKLSADLTEDGTTNKVFTATEQTKLSGIESDAEVNDVTDVQINGTSILSSKVANIVTNTAYDATTNKIATMSDLPAPVDISSKMDKANPTGTGSLSLNRKANTTIGTNSVAVGYDTTASGTYSHAEGYNTIASNGSAHAEGGNTTASGASSHAEGKFTTASGGILGGTHAEGYYTIASGAYSHAEGCYTTAQRKSQHTFGEYNVLDTGGTSTSSHGDYVEIVGNGTADNARSNARTLDWSGNETLAGNLIVKGGKISDGKNAFYKLAIPDTTSWAVDRTIATTDQIPASIAVTNANNNFSTSQTITGTVTATTFNATSDRRLKKNIKAYKPKFSILDLPIKQFDYKVTDEHSIGCLAQDLQKICPEIVKEDEKGYLSIEESKIVYLLLQEVKDLKKEIQKLKGE